jgi:hypothetical protein
MKKPVAADLPNAERVVAALKGFGFNLPTLSTVVFLKEKQIVRMGHPSFASFSSDPHHSQFP